jgi:hypothetical protein
MLDKPTKFHDPRGTVECSHCDNLGRPASGVTTERIATRVHVSFDLPVSWIVSKGELICYECSKVRK